MTVPVFRCTSLAAPLRPTLGGHGSRRAHTCAATCRARHVTRTPSPAAVPGRLPAPTYSRGRNEAPKLSAGQRKRKCGGRSGGRGAAYSPEELGGGVPNSPQRLRRAAAVAGGEAGRRAPLRRVGSPYSMPPLLRTRFPPRIFFGMAKEPMHLGRSVRTCSGHCLGKADRRSRAWTPAPPAVRGEEACGGQAIASLCGHLTNPWIHN